MIKTALLPKPANKSFYIGKPSFYNFNEKKEHTSIKELIYTLDETPDFHDPLSEVSLFLTQKIRQTIYHYNLENKWTVKLQNTLIEEIIPDFQERFPQFRLGVSALRKIWEKINYYSGQIQSQKEAINQDGKINLSFFIKENLKQSLYHGSDLSYYFTHKLAMQLSECIAVVNGEKPKLDHLTKLIWASQKNLLKNSLDVEKSPYNENDKIDRLIAQTIFDITSRQPQITQAALQYQTRESIRSLYELPGFTSLDEMNCNVAALLAEKFYPHSSFHAHFRSEQKKAILDFMNRHIALYKTGDNAPSLTEFVRRTLSLYMLATKLPKTIEKHEVKEAVLSIYPVHKDERPPLDQIFYAFISAEIVLLKNKEYCYSIEYVAQSIQEAYEQAKALPDLDNVVYDLLEMVLWKTINDHECLLEKLPYLIGQKIEEQIGRIMIDFPDQNFKGTVHAVLQYFKKVKELGLCKKWEELERKIYTLAIQGEMLYKWVRHQNETPLFREVGEKCSEENRHDHSVVVAEICQSYLRKYPSLAMYLPQLNSQIWVLYKSFWYQKKKECSAFERFLDWNKEELLSKSPKLSEEDILNHLEEVCEKSLPMIPFDSSLYQTLFNEKKTTPNDEGDAQILAHSQH